MHRPCSLTVLFVRVRIAIAVMVFLRALLQGCHLWFSLMIIMLKTMTVPRKCEGTCTSFWYRKLTLILPVIIFNKVKGSNEYPTPYLFNSPLYIFLVFFTSLMKLYTLKLHNLNTHYTVNTSYIMCIIISPSQLLCREVKREYCFNINLLVVQNFILLSYM